jgi:hypothetical protein
MMLRSSSAPIQRSCVMVDLFTDPCRLARQVKQFGG